MAPIVAVDALPRGTDGRAQLRDDPARERAGVQQPLGLPDADRGCDGAAEEQAGNVRDEEEPLGAEADGERRGRLVRVHVQRADSERCDNRNQSGGKRLLDRRRARGKRRADESELGHLHRVEADLVAEEGHRPRPDRGADPGVDGGERVPHDGERLGARHAPSLDEADLEAGALELGRDLRPSAVDDADVVPLSEAEHERPALLGDGATDLQDDEAHVR